MSEGIEPAIKQDSTTPAPGAASDNPLDAPQAPPAETAAREDEEMGDAPKDEAAPNGEGTSGVDGPVDAKTKESIENAAREHLISQTHSIVLPSYSTWFDMGAIHDLHESGVDPLGEARMRFNQRAFSFHIRLRDIGNDLHSVRISHR